MHPANPLSTPHGEAFVVADSDLAFFDNFMSRVEGCVILFCREGSADISIGSVHGVLKRHSLAVLLPGALLLLTARTDDFRVTYCVFSHDLFAEAAFRLEPSFFHALREHPLVNPSQRVIDGTTTWLAAVTYTYHDRENVFRQTIIRNRLQNLLLEVYDKMLRAETGERDPAEATNRQTEIFHRFVSLLHEHSSQEREVAFYADKLCISTRYLSTIVHHIARTSAKKFIDRTVVLEIKMLLQSSDLSVQEIAYRMKFPDQSYLGRFFKKHTGESPSEYRNNKK